MPGNRGRKPGIPEKYTRDQFIKLRAEAKALYLAGYNPDEIDTKLDLTDFSTFRWAKTYNWDVEREIIMKQVTTDRLQELLKQQEETFNELKIIKEKAIEVIISDEVVPTKFSEATNAYLNTIEVERKLKTEALQISFISDVAKVLKDKIQDRALLFEIAEGLKEIFNKYQSKSLSSNDKIMSEE